MRELKKISTILEEAILKLQYLHTVRWVAIKIGALIALVKDWKSIIVHLESVTTKEKGNAAAEA